MGEWCTHESVLGGFLHEVATIMHPHRNDESSFEFYDFLIRQGFVCI